MKTRQGLLPFEMTLHLHCVAGQWKSPPLHHHRSPELRTVQAPSAQDRTNKGPTKSLQVSLISNKNAFLIPVNSFSLLYHCRGARARTFSYESQLFVKSGNADTFHQQVKTLCNQVLLLPSTATLFESLSKYRKCTGSGHKAKCLELRFFSLWRTKRQSVLV